MMKNRKWFLITILIGLYSSHSQPQTQNYEVSVNTVTVWVRALDTEGNPVQGLSIEDFEMYENKLKVPLTCFEEIGGQASEASATTTDNVVPKEPLPKKRLVFYLDLFSLSGAEYNDLRPAMNKFLGTIPQKNWQVMMAALMPDGKLRILVQTTDDFGKVRSTLDHLPAQSMRDLEMVKRSKEIEGILRLMQGTEREGIIRKACQTANLFAIEERDTSMHSLKALDTLMESLSLEEPAEQKVIAHFSAGFNSAPGRVYYEIIEKVAGVDLDEIQFQMPECGRDLSFHPSRNVQKTMGGMKRSNVTLYSINTRALYPGLAFQRQNTTINISESSLLSDYRFFQEAMAEESGGQFFPNLRKFDENINKVMNDLEHQYILCYRQPEQKVKSDYRDIKVRCKKKGVEVRHRKGYMS